MIRTGEKIVIAGKDTDLCRRLADRGLASVVVSEATMLHHGHSTVARPEFGSAMERQMLRSRYLYYRKYFGRREAALAMLIVKAELTARAANPRGWSTRLVHRWLARTQAHAGRRLVRLAQRALIPFGW